MTTSVSAVATLESLIESGAFASQTETYLNDTFRHSSEKNWYKEAIKAEGIKAAERQLAEWVERGHYAVYGSSVEPIARGIVALAKAKNDSLVDITTCKTHVYTSINSRYGSHSKFIAFNTQAPGCGCVQPAGSYIFGPSGELGLQALILETGYGHRGYTTELSLVLPAWGTGGYAPKPGNFVIAKLDTTGYSSGDKYSPYIYTDEGTKAFTDTDAFLRHLLGMRSIKSRVGAMQTSSGIDQVIGFPGAKDYLATKLPELGNYFVALAEKLTTPHKH